jgi:hypothetical protein
MPLYDAPPHTISLLKSGSSRDSGGGTSVSYTSAQTSVACSIKTASSSTKELFAQQEITVTHTVAVLASALTAVPEAGWKVTTADRAESFHVHGIRHGRAYGGVPAFVYLDCESHAS